MLPLKVDNGVNGVNGNMASIFALLVPESGLTISTAYQSSFLYSNRTRSVSSAREVSRHATQPNAA